MVDETKPLPRTVPAQIQEDAPSLLPFIYLHPDIPVVTHSSPEYSIIHQEYNTGNTTVPLGIIFPANVLELRAAVKFCTSQKPPIHMTVRGGGHDAYGRNALTGAVQLDLRLMKSVHILKSASPSQQETAVVTIGPGITAIEMQRSLAGAGLAAPTGWVGTVGIIGWACGGGYGMETGIWGLGVDNILGAKLVLPRGELIDTDDDPERLLWAIRGAGLGNFGVICELRLKAYPNPRYLAGFLVFPLSEGESVMGGLQQIDDRQGLPSNFSGEITVNTTHPGPAINIMFAWTCEIDPDFATGWALLEKLKTLGTVLLNTVAETSVLKHHELIHASSDFNARGYTTMHSTAIPRLSAELIRIVMARPAISGGASCILFHHAHGRTLQPNSAAAWAHRDKHYICTPCGFAGSFATSAEQESSKLWADDLFQTIQKSGFGLEKGYWSMSRPEQCDAIKYFGHETVSRLRRLKGRVNPDDHFPVASPVLGNPQTESLPIADSKL